MDLDPGENEDETLGNMEDIEERKGKSKENRNVKEKTNEKGKRMGHIIEPDQDMMDGQRGFPLDVILETKANVKDKGKDKGDHKGKANLDSKEKAIEAVTGLV